MNLPPQPQLSLPTPQYRMPNGSRSPLAARSSASDGRARRRVAVLDPLLKLFGRAGADVGGEIRRHAAEPAEADELVGAELVGLGFLAPAAESARTPVARADAVAPVILVGKAAARPADDDRPKLADVLDQRRRMPSMFGTFDSGPTQIPS